MNIYFDLLFLAIVVVFVVDLSGFTDTWLGWLSKFTRRFGYPPVKELRPFSCSLCMTWWTGILYVLIRNNFTLPILAYIAALAWLSFPLSRFLIFIYEGLIWILNRIWPR